MLTQSTNYYCADEPGADVRNRGSNMSFHDIVNLLMIGQFRLYRCKGMSGAAALHTFSIRRQYVLKTIVYEPSGGQIVKSQKISVFKMFVFWINSSNGNRLSRPNCTQTRILCKFYL